MATESASAQEHRPRPKVLLLITLAEVGGAQTYVAELLPGLVDEFDVVVAAHGDGPLVEATRAAGARFVPLHSLRRPVHPVRDLAGLVELVRLFHRERPDIVHANSSKAGVVGRLAAVLARVPSRVFTVHGWAFSTTVGPLSRLYLWLDRALRPVTSLVICVSHVDRELGLRMRTCHADRSTVIWNAVDVAATPRASLSGDPPVFASVGRLQAPQKDFLTLLRAVALLPRGSLRVLVVGDGPDRDELLAEHERLALGADVELVGVRNDVPELLAACDGFVLATTYESLPLSIIEAMAAGLPCVVSDVGGVPELVVDGETGLLVPPSDPPALAAALGRLAADPALRRTLGAASLARAEACFDLPGFRAAHLDEYRRLVSRADVPAPVPTTGRGLPKSPTTPGGGA
jgi:glycosyltransferase involved in cell wall biosynthesis